jgi:hypothetical protein
MTRCRVADPVASAVAACTAPASWTAFGPPVFCPCFPVVPSDVSPTSYRRFDDVPPTRGRRDPLAHRAFCRGEGFAPAADLAKCFTSNCWAVLTRLVTSCSGLAVTLAYDLGQVRVRLRDAAVTYSASTQTSAACVPVGPARHVPEQRAELTLLRTQLFHARDSVVGSADRRNLVVDHQSTESAPSGTKTGAGSC